jgi:DNA-binding transcriptional ArsR family regulator
VCPSVMAESRSQESRWDDTLTDELGSVSAQTWRQSAEKQRLSDPLLELMASRFRLLGEPLRLKLLAALVGGERSVGELVALMGTSQPNVSKHLAALAQGGLVQRRKVGTTTFYAIADVTVFTLCDAVCAGLQEQFAAQARALGLNYPA